MEKNTGGNHGEQSCCPYLADLLSFSLGELADDEDVRLREHLLEGCGTCGAELRAIRLDLASLDAALADRAQLRTGRATFEQTRAALGVRLQALIAERGTQGPGHAHQTHPGPGQEGHAAGGAPLPCPPLEPTGAEGIEMSPSRHGAWAQLEIPGIRVRVLASDDSTRRWTCLVEMAPGTRYPAHRHRGKEECLVLSGDLEIGGQILHRGDFLVAQEGSLHAAHTSESGCQFLIAASWDNEVVE